MTRFSLLGVLLPIFISGCGESEKHKVVHIETYTYQVPATTKEECDLSVGGAIGGAALGGYFFGTEGALLGGAIGANQGECKKIHVPERTETGYLMHMDNGRCFHSAYPWPMDRDVPFPGTNRCRTP